MTTKDAIELLHRAAPYTSSPLFKTFLLFIAIGVGRILLNRMVANPKNTVDERRRWLIGIRNGALFLLIVGAIIIWAQELQSLLLSVVAIAAALVLATKELIMCVSGGLMRTSTGAFHIGDRIEINNYRGDVIDHGLFATTILEIGPGHSTHQLTGRTVVLPNSMFLAHPLINEMFGDDYVLHTFLVCIDRKAPWDEHEKALMESAHEVCGEYLEDARKFLEVVTARRNLDTINVDPRITVKLTDPSRIEMLVRVPVPSGRKGRTEQAILRHYLAKASSIRQPSNTVCYARPE